MAVKNSSFIDFRGLFLNYARHWYLFVVSVILCLGVGFVATKMFKQKYGVRANILIQQEESTSLGSLTSVSDLMSGSSTSVDDEIFVISSHSLTRDLVKKLRLNVEHRVRKGFMNSEIAFPDYPLDVTFDPAIADTLRSGLLFDVKVKEDGKANVKIIGGPKSKVLEKVKDITLPHTFNTPYGDFTVEKTSSFPVDEELRSKISISGYHATAEALALEIATEIPSKRSNVINLAINITNSALGEAILNNLIELYNERGIKEQNLERQKTALFLEKRLKSLGEELANAELKIQKFKEDNSLVDVKAQIEYQNTKKGLIDEQLIASQTQLEVLKLEREFLNDPANRFASIPNMLENQSINEAINKYNAKIAERDNLLRNVSPNNVLVEKITTTINSARSSIVASINQAYENTLVTINDLKSQIKAADSSMINIPSQERAYYDMERDRMIKNEIYLLLLNKQEENSIKLANSIPKGVIVDEAFTLDKMLGPRALYILVAFFLIGLCLPPIYLYVMKLLRNRFETREEVEDRINVPILGEMCTDRSGRSLVVSATDTSSATELFRLMRANLLFVLNEKTDKVVLLTSTTSGEGKSFISINLAASMALLGKKVLLVGMDIRAPKLSSYLNITSRYGLTQYLANDSIQLSDIINKHPEPGIPTLDVILAGPIPPNPAELLASHRVEVMFEELRGMYDYIIVDTAPVGMVSDTFTLDRIADATVYVTRVNYSLNSHLDFIQEIYNDNRLKKLSVVINGVRSKKTYGYSAKKGQADH